MTKEKTAPLIELIKYVLSLFQHVFITAGAILIEYNPELNFLVEIIKEKGNHLRNSLFRNPWALYPYCPDRRVLIARLIGKQSPGLMPPF